MEVEVLVLRGGDRVTRKLSSSSNPPGGRWCGGPDAPPCDYCDRYPAEWRFERKRPTLAASFERSLNTFGCGIHWKQAQREARGEV